MSLGLFDIANPILLPLDDALAKFLPPVARVVVVAALLTWFGMWLYRISSGQKHLRALKRLARRGDRGLHDPNIEFNELLRRARRSIGLQMAILARVFVPSVLGMVPLLFGMSAVSSRYSHSLPDVETPRTWCVQPETAATRIRLNDKVMPTACVELPWEPGFGARVQFDDVEVTHDLGKGASNILHQRLWWNLLIGNPGGYLPDSAGMTSLSVKHPDRQLVGFGPGWIRHWLFWFLVPSVVLGFYWRWRWKLV